MPGELTSPITGPDIGGPTHPRGQLRVERVAQGIAEQVEAEARARLIAMPGKSAIQGAFSA
jgi:hypothetical protein